MPGGSAVGEGDPALQIVIGAAVELSGAFRRGSLQQACCEPLSVSRQPAGCRTAISAALYV